MKTKTWIGTCIAMAFLAMGCADQKKMDAMQAEMMKPPVRPAEMDQLAPWIGTWEGTGEMTMHGKTMKMSGTDKYDWDLDKNVVTIRYSMTMEGGPGMERGPAMEGMGFMVYCTHEKEFKGVMYGAMEGMGHSSMKWCEKDKSWHMKGTRHDPHTGQKSTGEGTIKFPDNNTMEWTFTESQGLCKVGTGKGTAHRKA